VAGRVFSCYVLFDKVDVIDITREFRTGKNNFEYEKAVEWWRAAEKSNEARADHCRHLMNWISIITLEWMRALA
jgi:hypothetical protein